MHRISRRHVGIALVVLAVALAGCGGDGGTPVTPTETVGETTPTPTESGPATTPTETAPEPTPTETAATETATATETPVAGFDTTAHRNAVRSANRYTVQINTTMVTTEGGTPTVTRANVTQRHIVQTGESYSIWRSQGTSFEYYRPPNATTAYLYISGQVQQVPPSQAFVLNYTTLTSQNGANTGFATQFDRWGDVGTGSTTLGPARTYTIDSVDQLPQSVRDAYDEVRSVRYRLWVDEDTGILAKYDYRLVVVEEGEELTTEGSIEVLDLGTTTIETPSWAP